MHFGYQMHGLCLKFIFLHIEMPFGPFLKNGKCTLVQVKHLDLMPARKDAGGDYRSLSFCVTWLLPLIARSIRGLESKTSKSAAQVKNGFETEGEGLCYTQVRMPLVVCRKWS